MVYTHSFSRTFLNTIKVRSSVSHVAEPVGIKRCPWSATISRKNGTGRTPIMSGKHPPTTGSSGHLITNPVANLAEALPQGSYIITGGMYGSGQERIIVHTGGVPSAPPSSQQQLSPVFFMPPSNSGGNGAPPTPAAPAEPGPLPQQRVLNMTSATALASKGGKGFTTEPEEDNHKTTTSLSLPSFGDSFDQLSHNNGLSPLLEPKITRTPLPVIGGKTPVL